MHHRATANFWAAYDALPDGIRARADKSFALLKRDHTHRSLRLKKIGADVWSVRVTLGYRALALEEDNGLAWFWIGPHDEYERLIKSKS